jgi:hypothetical protein
MGFLSHGDDWLASDVRNDYLFGMKSRGRGRWKRRGKAAGLILGGSAVVLVLALARKPSWYRPVTLDEQGLERVRAEAATAVDDVSRRLVAGESFELKLSERTLNEWIVTLLHHRPEWSERIPREWSNLAVAFEDNLIRPAALYEREGWRAIVSLDVAVEIDSSVDELRCTARGVRIGALRVPFAMVPERVFGPLIERGHGRYDLAGGPNPGALGPSGAGLSSGSLPEVRIRNRFVWPNGERPFRFRGIQSRTGALSLLIEPLHEKP